MSVCLSEPALFKPSNANPPAIEPSPMTATVLYFSLLNLAAFAIPSAADTDTEECPAPKESYSLSAIRGKPLMPPSFLFVEKASRRPVIIL